MSEESESVSSAERPNPFAMAKSEGGGMIDVAGTRAAQEVQAMCVVAKRFPRDQEKAFSKIMTSCKRISLAECATYVYPKGGSQVTGPSIRLAECLAQNWGNLDFGIIELEQRNGESTVMAYAWDMETGTRQTKIFTVKHERRVGKGQNFRIDRLTDPRDIYEMTANQGARRLRACILGVIPGDIVDAAVEECDKTLKSGGKNEPLIDRVRRMVGAFNDFGVTPAMIEKRLGHNLGAIIEQELVLLRKIYTSIKDGMGKAAEYFEPALRDDLLMQLAFSRNVARNALSLLVRHIEPQTRLHLLQVKLGEGGHFDLNTFAIQLANGNGIFAIAADAALRASLFELETLEIVPSPANHSRPAPRCFTPSDSR